MTHRSTAFRLHASLISLALFGCCFAVQAYAQITGSERQLNAIIYKVRSKSDIPVAIEQISAFAKAHPKDYTAQLYGQLVKPLPEFAGILYRLRPLAEKVDVLHFSTLRALSDFKNSADTRAPFFDALFEYMTSADPLNAGTNAQKLRPFTNLGEMQDWILKVVLPAVESYATLLEGSPRLAQQTQSEPLLSFDHGLYYGEAVASQMTSQRRRFVKVLAPHLDMLAAELHEVAGMLSFACAYNLDKLADFSNTLTRKTLLSKVTKINTAMFDIRFQTPREVADLLSARDRFFPSLLTLKPAAQGSGGLLQRALTHFRKAADMRVANFNQLKRLAALPNQGEYLIDAKAFITHPEDRSASLNKAQAMWRGSTLYRDPITGKSFTVNLPKAFDTNETGIRDLRGLYANQFVQGNQREKGSWNFAYGKAIGWRDPTFAGVLPDAGDSEESARQHTALSHEPYTAPLLLWLNLFR